MSSKLRKTLSRKKNKLLSTSSSKDGGEVSNLQDFQKLIKRVELLSEEMSNLKAENAKLQKRVASLEADNSRIRTRMNITSYNAYETINGESNDVEPTANASNQSLVDKVTFVSLDVDNELKRAEKKRNKAQTSSRRTRINLDWYRNIRRRIQLSFSRQV